MTNDAGVSGEDAVPQPERLSDADPYEGGRPGTADTGAVAPLVGLQRNHVTIEPGQVERVGLTVRNASGIVEGYSITALGPAAPFVEILPDEMSLFPGDEGTATVTFRPPRIPSAVAGDYVVGIRAMSHVTRDTVATDEIVVTLAPFYLLATDVSRTTFAVRTKAVTQIQVTNRGNSTMTYKVSAVDPEGYMTVTVDQVRVTLAPGESAWVPIRLKMAPRLFGTSNDTRSATATVVPLLNADTGMPILEAEPHDQRINVIHRPIIRLRMGGFGRFVFLITILALVAAVIFARMRASAPPEDIGAPPVPQNFSATLNEQGQPVLTWTPASGATQYSIYGIGTAGDPIATPSPSVVPAQPSPAGVAPAVVSPAIGPARATIVLAGATPSPSAQPSEVQRATPVCNDCGEITTVDGGTTRYVVTAAPPGYNCYRIAAKVGTTQSLYSPSTCIVVPGANIVVDPSGQPVVGPDGQLTTTTPPPPVAPVIYPPCPPADVVAQALPTGGIALVWSKPTAPPKGMAAPAPSPAPGAGSSAAADPSTSPSRKPARKPKVLPVCDPAKAITGWTAQRQLLGGWADVTPRGQANDTAMEIANLSPGAEYCFRLRADAADASSPYSPVTCAKTPPSAPGGAPSASVTPVAPASPPAG